MDHRAPVQLTSARGPRAPLRLLLAIVVVAGLLAPSAASAGRTVVVLLRGFNASQGDSGMDRLAASLEARLGGNPEQPFSRAVYNYTEVAAAFAFIDGFTDIDCLVVGGHSFGGAAAIELVTDFLDPAGIPVDLLIQFDSVGANDGVLPVSVGRGINYYQVSTGFFEPEGERNVVGSENVYVELDYGVADSVITHTRIDCPQFEYDAIDYAALFGSQPDLYARIGDEVEALCATAVPTLAPLSWVIFVSVLLRIGVRERTLRG